MGRLREFSIDAQTRKDRAQPGGRDVFQHRHYAEIARIIRELDGVPRFNRAEIALHFAKELDVSNVRFDRERFLRATGD